MLLNPYFWVAAFSICLSCAFGGYEYAQKGIEQERAVAKAALDAANQHAQEITNERNKSITDISGRLADTQAKADQAAKALRNNLSTGAVRLSIAGSCGSPVSGDPTAANTNNPGSCNIDPGAAQALVAITERGDSAIEKLNSCIAAYNSLLDPK